MPRDTPFVSVVIPVYNGQDYVSSCVKQLKNQTYPRKDYEIIVVDNMSTDSTREIIESNNLGYLTAETAGPSAARNVGIQNASGDIIIFIDIDCFCDPDFIERHVKAHHFHYNNDERIQVIGGSISGINNNFFAFCDDYSSWYHYHPKMDVRENAIFLPTANLSVAREVFSIVGGFDENLRYGEDLAFCMKLRDANIRVCFDPSAKLKHVNRTSIADLFMHAVNWGMGDNYALFNGYRGKPNRILLLLNSLVNVLIYMLHPAYCCIRTKRWAFIIFFPFVAAHRAVFALTLVWGAVHYSFT